MRIVFLGTAPIARPVLRALHAAGHEVGAVVTQPDRPKGRSGKPLPSPVKEEALALALAPIYQPERLKKRSAREHLEALGPFDLGVVTAYGQILTPEALAVPRLGMVNVHASLLPRWRGAAPVQRAILAGDGVTGVTIMRVVPALDAGNVLARRPTPIGPDDTSETVLARLGDLGAALLVETLADPAFADNAGEPQDPGLVTSAPPIEKAEGRIDWSRPPEDTDRRLRAMVPWPGSFTWLHRRESGKVQRVVVLAGRPLARAEGDAPPGLVVDASPRGVTVGCGERGAFRITRVQPAGKRAMAAGDWLRGRGVDPGDVFAGPDLREET